MEVQNQCFRAAALGIGFGSRVVIQDHPNSVKYPDLIRFALRLSLVSL